MTIQESVTKNGTRKTARMIVDQRVKNLCGGLGIDDLPDTNELCSIVDCVEEALEQTPFDKPAIKSALEEIDEQFIEQLLFS